MNSKQKTIGLLLIPALLLSGAAIYQYQANRSYSRPADAPTKIQGANSTTSAWIAARQDIREILENTPKDDSEIRRAAERLQAFGDEHPNTAEAAIAYLNHGAISAKLGDLDHAKQSLEAAIHIDQDPNVSTAARSLLAKLQLSDGATPPAFTAQALDGTPVALTDLKGKVVLLDFWATWCGPCIGELPNLQEAYKEYHAKGLEIVSISLDYTSGELERFISKHPMPWHHIYDKNRSSEERLASQYAVDSIPFTVLIGRDGQIISTNLRGKQLFEAVATAL